MKRHLKVLLGAAIVAIPTLFAAPAYAQATRTWVSGVGDDANPCSRTAPCKTYAGAISKTATGGEINCVDPGGYGAVTIVKSISIVCDYSEGGVLATGTNAFIINAPLGSIITLKGHDVDCLGTGLSGIKILGAGVTVHLHKVQIRNCRGGSGIVVGPSSGIAKVFVADSYITDNGAATGNAGILIRPTAGASANVSVNRVQFESNSNGIFADGTGGAGPCNITVNDSLLGGSSNAGIVVSSTSANFRAVVASSTINLNANVGVAVAGAGATLWLGGSTVSSNVNGVLNLGGALLSYKNNVIIGNGSDGTPLLSADLQ